MQAAKYVIGPFLNVLHYIHGKEIIHRDIKPENLLLDASGSLKLADFGLSIVRSEENPVTRVGTVDYMAPEVVRCPRKRYPDEWKDRLDLVYTASVDIWALGVLVFELVIGHAPFKAVRLRFHPYSALLPPSPPLHHVACAHWLEHS